MSHVLPRGVSVSACESPADKFCSAFEDPKLISFTTAEPACSRLQSSGAGCVQGRGRTAPPANPSAPCPPPPPAPPPPPGPQHSLPQGPVGIARPDLHGETEAALPAGVPPRLGAPRAPERPSAPMSLRPGEGRGEEELGRICSLSTKELISLGK